MTICDLCRRKVNVIKEKVFINVEKNTHLCVDCVTTCKEIVTNPNTSKVTNLNEYKDLKAQGLI